MLCLCSAQTYPTGEVVKPAVHQQWPGQILFDEFAAVLSQALRQPWISGELANSFRNGVRVPPFKHESCVGVLHQLAPFSRSYVHDRPATAHCGQALYRTGVSGNRTLIQADNTARGNRKKFPHLLWGHGIKKTHIAYLEIFSLADHHRLGGTVANKNEMALRTPLLQYFRCL